MGTENPTRPNFPSRPTSSPFAAAPAAAQTMTPFSTTGPVAGSEPPSFRPTTPAPPQAPTPFSSSGPAVRPGAPSFRPTPPGRFNDPSVPPPPPSSNVPPMPTAGAFQHFPAPPFSSTVQPPLTRPPPLGQPSIHQHASQPPPFPPSIPPQPQMPYVQMGSPPMGSNVPPPQFQSSVPGYARMQPGAEIQAPPMHSSIHANQGNYGPPPPASSSPFLPHQGGYASSLPVGNPIGIQPTQQPGYVPPTGTIQGLTEDFSSLTMQTRPGTLDPLFDAKELPRPLDGDAGSLNVLFTNPIWVLVTRMQTHTQAERKILEEKKEALRKAASESSLAGSTLEEKLEKLNSTKPKPFGTIHAANEVYNEAGIVGFWKGVIPALIMVCNPSIQFMIYESSLKHLRAKRSAKKQGDTSVTALEVFLVGAIAKLGATVTTYPLLVVKSRLQAKQEIGGNNSLRYSGTFDAILKMIRYEGFPGFYKGMSTKIVQSVFAASVLFMVKEELVKAITVIANKSKKVVLNSSS